MKTACGVNYGAHRVMQGIWDTALTFTHHLKITCNSMDEQKSSIKCVGENLSLKSALKQMQSTHLDLDWRIFVLKRDS